MIGWLNVIGFIALVTCAISAVLWWVERGDDDDDEERRW